jgi:AraC-like DNA-binding protein
MRALPEPFHPLHTRPEGQSFVAFAYACPRFAFYWHYHPHLELTLIESGAGTRFVGDSIAPFGPGDLALLGGNLPHTWSSEATGRRAGPRSHRVLVAHFPRELFAPDAVEFRKIRRLLQRAERGCTFSAPVAARAAAEFRKLIPLRGFAAWSQLASILNLLAGDPAPTLLASAGYTPAVRQGAQHRLERALAYVDAQADSDALCLRDVARTVHLTPAAFSRFFRHMTGGTLVAHINQVRVGRACHLLSESDRSVTEIAYACGFRNIANFNRRFRALKRMTPTAYRAHFKAGPR